MRFPSAGQGVARGFDGQLVPAQQLAGELDIGLRARAAQIVEQRRLAVGGCLGQADIARDHRIEDLVAEMPADIGRDHVAQIVSPVVHRQDYAFYFKI